jgi:hypothetical protein
MPTITTADGTDIFYKDWGSGQPIVFSHGWPLSSDDWDTQLMFFLLHGYRVPRRLLHRRRRGRPLPRPPRRDPGCQGGPGHARRRRPDRALADSGPLSAKLVQNGTLKTYHGFPHGMPTTQADTINPTCSPSSRPDRASRHRVGEPAEPERPVLSPCARCLHRPAPPAGRPRRPRRPAALACRSAPPARRRAGRPPHRHGRAPRPAGRHEY